MNIRYKFIVGIVTGIFASFWAANVSAISYDYVTEAIKADSSISYDEDNQALLVIDFNALESEYVRYQDHDTYSGMLAEYFEKATVDINGTPYEGEYLVVSGNGTVQKEMTSHTYPWKTGNINLYPDNVSVLILDIGDSYDIWMDRDDYTWARSLAGRPVTPEDEGHFTNTISNPDIYVETINFETYIYNGFNIELWMVDKEKRKIDNPGFLNYNTYVTMKFELRDPDGNISPMKTNEVFDSFGMYGSVGGSDQYLNVLEGGLVRIDIGDSDDPNALGGYGELDGLTFPTGYDFRITVFDYGEEMGQFANLYLDYYGAEADEDGFISGDEDKYIFAEVTFLPRTGEIRIENFDPNNNQEADNGIFQVLQQVTAQTRYWSSEIEQYIPNPLPEYKQPMSNFSYKVYDINTDEEIEADVLHKTDANGCFTLKTNQYAIFKVYEYPDDMDEYESWGINIFDAIEIQPDIATENRDYYVAAVDNVNYEDIYNGDGTKFTKNFAPIKRGETLTYVVAAQNILVPDTGSMTERETTALLNKYNFGIVLSGVLAVGAGYLVRSKIRKRNFRFRRF